ncbi:hypothetical protein Pla86_09230 [Planctomycetes bacterium Pla86]|uniref:Uncharacterized protein n=1 Tax=Engelhardtia mirabilis TaxID=2528011 RepID=A0A518BFV7_9BACT|nr:hypothetical protein Pla133_09240 [Planctomycetes bacterium Pla133]QDV00184.1 hypothetical protein Pla86_09230 [Planctomycetes bacterium Pla86]
MEGRKGGRECRGLAEIFRDVQAWIPGPSKVSDGLDFMLAAAWIQLGKSSIVATAAAPPGSRLAPP